MHYCNATIYSEMPIIINISNAYVWLAVARCMPATCTAQTLDTDDDVTDAELLEAASSVTTANLSTVSSLTGTTNLSSSLSTASPSCLQPRKHNHTTSDAIVSIAAMATSIASTPGSTAAEFTTTMSAVVLVSTATMSTATAVYIVYCYCICCSCVYSVYSVYS